MKVKIKKAIAAGATAAALIAAIANLGISNEAKNELENFVELEQPSVDSTFLKRVEACKDYMAYALKNQGYTLDSTKLRPETLVKAADNYSFDLPFLMAAAHQESCFGANNRAQITNSVFSVGSYDNGKNAVYYDDPNDSVSGYLNLLNAHYLIDGKTIFDLLKPGCFVNELGKRYAKDKDYENNIRSIRNRILRMYPELS